MDFDVSKYNQLKNSADKELCIFQWVTQLNTQLLQNIELKTRQTQLEQILLEILHIPPPGSVERPKARMSWLNNKKPMEPRKGLMDTPVPKPTRIIRDLVASCLTKIYTLGDVTRLADCLYAVQQILLVNKKWVETETRLSAINCMGVFFERLAATAGFRLLSCFNDFFGILARLVRATDEPIEVRVQAIQALAQVIGGGGKTATEQQSKDVLKLAKNSLANKSPNMVLGAVSVLRALVAGTSFMKPPNRSWFEAESFISGSLVPLLANEVLVVRRAVARLIGTIITHNITLVSPEEVTSPPAIEGKKTVAMRAVEEPRPVSANVLVRNSLENKTIEKPEDEGRRGTINLVRSDSSQSVVPVKSPKPTKSPTVNGVATLGQALKWLSKHFTMSTASRELRAGLVDAYRAVLGELGRQVVEDQYLVILDHVLNELVTEEMDRVAVRNICGYLLREPLARQLLGEQGKIKAANWIYSEYLTSDRTDVLLIGLREWQMLVEDLGLVSRTLEVNGEVLEQWLTADEDEAVPIHAARAMAALVGNDKEQVPQILRRLVGKFQETQSVGYAYGVVGILGQCQLMDVPLDQVEWIHSQAIQLLKTVYNQNDPEIVGSSRQQPGQKMARELRNRKMVCGWMLLTGLTQLGKEMSERVSAEWMPLWLAALPDNATGFVTAEMGWKERSYLVRSKTMALSHLLMYLKSQSDRGIQRRMVGCLKHALLFADNALEAPLPPNKNKKEMAILVDLHMLLRKRVLECLQLLDEELLESVTLPTVRLIDQVVGSPDNLYEMYGSREMASCLRGFKGGSWAYERETGVSSLLGGTLLMNKELQGIRVIPEGDFGYGRHMRGLEYDWMQTMFSPQCSVSTYTGLVDSAVGMFGRLFPTLSEDAQLTVLDGLVLQLNGLPFNSHRYMAVLTNILVSLYEAVRHKKRMVTGRVARTVVEMARAALIVPQPMLRLMAGEVIGRLAAVTQDAASTYVPYLLDYLSNQAIRSKDRFARAGAAVALGALYANAGSLVAGGSALRQVVVFLHSLAADKDPVVHAWALGALAEAGMAAGYMFEPYAKDTFRMAIKLFMTDSHTTSMYGSSMLMVGERQLPDRKLVDRGAWQRQADETGVVLGQLRATTRADMAMGHPNSLTHSETHAENWVSCQGDMDQWDGRQALGHLVSSLILVFGPQLPTDGETKQSVMTLVENLEISEYVEARQQMWLFFRPAQEEIQELVNNVLRPMLRAQKRGLEVCVGALESLLRLYGDQVEMEMVREVMLVAGQTQVDKLMDTVVQLVVDQKKGEEQLVECLCGVFVNSEESVVKTLAIRSIQRVLENTQHPMVSILSELLRVGYMASTTNWLCTEGLELLRLVVRQFKGVEDPKMPGEGAPILGIYQAQLTSAFMPMLGTSEAAVGVAAAYVGSGLVDQDRGGLIRVLRQIAPSKENVPEGQGGIIRQLVVLDAWSEILEYAVDRKLVMEMARMHWETLYEGWLDVVRDAGVLVNQRQRGVGLRLGLEPMYTRLVREPLTKRYLEHLPGCLRALSVMMKEKEVETTDAVLLFAFVVQQLEEASGEVDSMLEMLETLLGGNVVEMLDQQIENGWVRRIVWQVVQPWVANKSVQAMRVICQLPANEDMEWRQSVLNAVVGVWKQTYQSEDQWETTAQCLDTMARLVNPEDKVFWLSAWRESVKVAPQVSPCLLRLEGGEKMKIQVLWQMLEQGMVREVAPVVGGQADAIQRLFVQKCVERMEEDIGMLEIVEIAPKDVLRLLVKDCLPQLAPQIMSQGDGTKALDILVQIARRIDDELVIAAIVMLLLSMTDREGVSEGIMELATHRGEMFKRIVVRLVATQPLAKQRLEGIIGKKKPIRVVEEDVHKIELKLEF